MALVTIAVLALGAARANGAVTIGGPLNLDPNDAGGPGEQTYIQVGLPGGAIVSSPITGVITRWRARGYTQGVDPAEILLRVMRPAGSDTFTAVSSSSVLLPTSLGTHQFPARVPIQKNDYIGLTQTPGNIIWLDCECAGIGGTFDFFPGPFADGQTRTSSPTNDAQVTINADVEADADGDGFGDETQDRCPVDASTQGICHISFGKLNKNRKKGTATLPVTVPGAGTLSLRGKGVVKQRPLGAFTAIAGRAVGGAGTVKLLVKTRGKSKRKLNRTGKARVKIKVIFTPTGGTTNTTKTKKLTLRKHA